MKLYEKIILTIFGIVFILQLFDFSGDAPLLALSTYLLSASYFVGGYWLFKGKENKTVIITILSGVALAIPLFNFPHLIWLRSSSYDYYLPIINGILFLFLAGYLYKSWKSNVDIKSLKLLFVRSLVILILTSFFTYIPIQFKPYRTIIYSLNNGNKYLQSNMKMFDYGYLSDEALDNKNCDAAIEYALKANGEAKTWLGISTSKRNDSLIKEEQRSRIRGTYSGIFEAYRCKANDYLKKGKYEKALSYYIKSDEALSYYTPKTEYWNFEQIFSINSQAVCYSKLNNYELADSLFVEAIEKYMVIKDTVGKDLAIIYSNLADSMSDQNEFEYSNLFYEKATAILQNGTINSDNKKEIIKNSYRLIDNYFQTDSLKQAKRTINKLFKIVDESTKEFCRVSFYEGIYLYRINKFKASDKVLTNCLECFVNNFKPGHQNIAEISLVLANVKVNLAEYNEARKFLKSGMKITSKNYGVNSERYANYLKVDADLDKILGNYKTSEAKYYKALELYENALGDRNAKMYEVLSSLANLEIILSKTDEAKKHSDASMSIADDYIYFDRPFETNLINDAAYVNYYIGNYKKSDSLYKKTIDINKQYKLESTLFSAVALNGQGLLKTAKKEYKIADSLFTESLNLHNKLLSRNHPLTAITLFNYANLKIKQKKYEGAKRLLDKSIVINSKFFNKNHDIFADIYDALGDVAKKERNHDLANDYYKKALDIYNQNFDGDHIKIIALNKKM